MSVFTSQVQLNASTSGYVQLQASATTTSYTLSMPPADGTSGQVLTTDGNGVLSWTSGGGSGGGGVDSFSAGTTGLTPATPSSGNIVLAGVLVIANGGTGAGNRNDALNNLLPSQTGVPSGYILQTDGTDAAWAQNTGGVVPSQQEEFETPGTWTAPANVYEVRISLAGGGGGGGAYINANGPTGSGGGGGGQVHEYRVENITPGASYAVTVGAGGSGGVNYNNGGNPGGTSSFDSFVSATGGTGGTTDPNQNRGGGSPDGAPGYGSQGGMGATGDLSGHGAGGPGYSRSGGNGQVGLVIVKWGGQA